MQTFIRGSAHDKRRPGFRSMLLFVFCWLAWLPLPAAASGSILIWPLNPVIESTATSTAMWVENRGKQVATMQLRVFAWDQEQGEDRYQAQTTVIGSPAIFRIEPGKRQLVRLTRTQSPPAGKELAYRVLIDEIPMAADSHAGSATDSGPDRVPPSGIRFQLRYSIPLFSYGAGIASKSTAGTEAPRLQWRHGTNGDQHCIEIVNRGSTHAKLTGISTRAADGHDRGVTGGGLSYVLAGSYRRLALPAAAAAPVSVRAGINGRAPAEFGSEIP